MNDDSIERRKNARVFFTLEEAIPAIISIHQGKVCDIPVTLLSISTGGVSIMGSRYKLPAISHGDRLILTGLSMPDPMGHIEEVETVIKYILDFRHNSRISVGCEFVGISSAMENRISDFVTFRVDQLGFILEH